SRRRHTRFSRDWSSDVCSSDLRPRRRQRGRNSPIDSTLPFGTGPSVLLFTVFRTCKRALQRNVLRPAPSAWLSLEGRSPQAAGKIGRASCREKEWEGKA